MTTMAFLPLLLFLWIGSTASTVVDLHKRVIGGRPCGSNERLYHVKLTDANSNLVCGGSLVSDQWILTAAHCWKDGRSLYPVFRGQSVTDQTITEHKIYKKRKNIISSKKPHDLMLLKLSAPTTIEPVPLPDCDHPVKVGDTVSIAGHAATTTGPDNTRCPTESRLLHCANINIVDCEQLRNDMKYSSNPQTKQMYKDWKNQHWFCGKGVAERGVDICLGDSGGGVEFYNMIYGVSSFTGDGHRACSSPGAFIDLCYQDYIQWIQDTINETKRGCGPSGLLSCG